MFPTDASTFSQFLSNNQFIIYAVIAALNGVLLFFSSVKFLLVLQQCGYHGKRYFKWLGSSETPYRSRLMLLSLLGFLFFCVLNMCFTSLLGRDIASYVGFVAYILFMVLYINTESAVNAKVPLKKTKRLVRLSATFILFLCAFTFGLLILIDLISFAIGERVVAILRYAIICIMPILSPYILFLAYCTNEPFEWAIRTHYYNVTKDKLARADVLKVAITGSYAKTSVKEMLKTILSQKYRVLATPESYNTPMGISLAVKNLDSTHDVFIAEFGARYKGDIRYLSKLVNPDIAVLTGINLQHLETFKSIENIKDTKYELFEELKSGGKAFFNSDSEGANELFGRFNGEKYLAGIDGKENIVRASDIFTDARGTKFVLTFEGEKSVTCSSVLLGRHSISNVCLAAAVAYKIGMTPEEIALGINRISSVGHRLELVPNNKDIVIIDDSYNSNTDGIKAAMEVLDIFSGKKIVVTPGLVELGKEENVANFNFGKLLAGHADKVIIIGNHNAETLINGLIEGGMDKSDISFAKNLKKGNEMLNETVEKGDVVLFENDLPDNYS